MKYENLKKFWCNEEQAAFSGWDFSHLDSRWHSEPLPWSYKGIIHQYLLPSHQLLDMGTGGGEFLLTLKHPYEDMSVTEAWEPNVLLCKERLTPLGVRVYHVQDYSQLPIDDNKFDIVINRHEYYDLHEVSRILKPGGIFITQQVGADNVLDFAKRINPDNLPLYSNFSLESELPKFKSNGLIVKYSNECYPELRFFDIGAVVFWAKIIEWSFPNFSVEKNFPYLCSLQDDLLQKGFVSAVQHRFIIIAQNDK